MEKVTSSLAIQEVELVKLQEEVDQLVADIPEHLVLDPPEELIKARVENEKLKYQLNILKRAVEKELDENKD